MVAISVTRALAELSLLKKRIAKLVGASFIGTVSQSTKSVHVVDEKTFVSNWQSLNDLLDRYRSMKYAIIASNAVTKVNIGGKSYTVAQAIAEKELLQQRTELLNNLRYQKTNVANELCTHGLNIQAKLDQFLETTFRERKSDEDSIRAVSEAYLKTNALIVVDPLHLDTIIEKMEEELGEFTKNVDFCLSESNATTMIDV